MLMELYEATLYPEGARFEYHVEHQTSLLRNRDFILSLHKVAHYLSHITSALFHVLLHPSLTNYIFPPELYVCIVIRRQRHKITCKASKQENGGAYFHSFIKNDAFSTEYVKASNGTVRLLVVN
jgi:hypothetical protein